MRLKTFVAISSLALTQCAGAPEKPVVEICVPDVPKMECICGMSNSSEQRREPIAYCDKATAFPPKEWEKVQNYLDEVKKYFETHSCTPIQSSQN